MTDRLLTEVYVNCPTCAAANRVAATYLSDGETVSCSHCRTPLGRWGELKQIMASRMASHSASGKGHAA